MPVCLENQMEWPNGFSQNGCCVVPLGTLTTAIAKSAIAWRTAKRGKAGPKQQDPMWLEVRRLGVERRCEKDPVKRKSLSIALYRARQLMRRTQTDLNFKKAVEAGAPSRRQGSPPPTRAPILEKLGADGTTEKVEDVDGRTHTVHKHCSRTSCADDHLVIEMLRELDQDMRETLARCCQFRLLNHWAEDKDMMWARKLVTMVKKKKGKLTMKGFRPTAMLSTMYRLHFKKNATTVGGPGKTHQVWTAVRSCPCQAHQVAFFVRLAQNGGASERVADTYLRDGLRRGGCRRPRLSSPDH